MAASIPVRSFWLALLLLAGLPRCACDDDLSTLRPRVRATPESIDMGRRPVGERSSATVTLGNTGTASANCSAEIVALDPELDAAAWARWQPEQSQVEGAAFSLDEPLLDLVMPSRSVERLVHFTPPGRGFFGGTLRFVCDDLDQPEARIPLFGEGGPPLIEVEPGAVDFGVVNEGPGAAREVRIRNVGFDGLRVSSVRVRDPYAEQNPALRPVFTLATPSPALSLGIDQSITLLVRMDPSAEALAADDDGILEGTLVIESNAEDTPVIEVPLSGGVNLAPLAVAVELVTRRTEVKVGTGREVIIDGNDTIDPEGDPFVFEWSLAELPAGSNAILVGSIAGSDCANDAMCAVDEGYRCIVTASSSRCRQVARTRLTPDAVGSYIVRLRATDSRGAYATADVTVLPRDLVIVLEWNESAEASCLRPGTPECDALSLRDRELYCCGQTDLDLHLLRPGGTLGDYGTCPSACIDGMQNRCAEDSDDNAASCRQVGSDCAYANRYPEWGQLGRADDPRLDMDDVRGYGPEIISLNDPADGTYQAVVHYCDDRIGEPTEARMAVYVKGELRFETPAFTLGEEGLAWAAVELVRSGGSGDGTWDFISPAQALLPDVPADLCQY